jgi:flagellar basal-body rod protein FlgB
VDIDREMTLMAANQMMYSTLTRLLSRKFQSLRSVISGGNR